MYYINEYIRDNKIKSSHIEKFRKDCSKFWKYGTYNIEG